MRQIILFLTTVFALCQPQEEKQKDDIVVITIPLFYESVSGLETWPQNIPKLADPPKNSRRIYYVNTVDNLGLPVETAKPISEEGFYRMIHNILQYGVLDNNMVFPGLNIYYIQLIRYLLDRGILPRDSLPDIIAWYAKGPWIESLYSIDEAIPGCVSSARWAMFENSGLWPGYYSTLVQIKRGISLNKIMGDLDAAFERDINNPNRTSDLFTYYAKAYGALIRKGAALNAKIAKLLAGVYFTMDPGYAIGFRALPLATGIIFDKETIESAVLDYLSKVERPIVNLVRDFRDMGFRFPKDQASKYKQALLEEFGRFEDIEYLEAISNEEIAPELWKTYANSSWHWYKTRKIRQGIEDPGDYYHYTIEAYSRVFDFIQKSKLQLKEKYDRDRAERIDRLSIDRKRIDDLIKAGDDLNVSTRDLLIAYKFGEQDLKWPHVQKVLDLRIAKIRERAAGAYYSEIEAIAWRRNEFGERLVPFADDIELAAALDDPDRTRQLADQIVQHMTQRLKTEAGELDILYRHEYARCERRWLSAELPYHLDASVLAPLFKDQIKKKIFSSLDTAAYAELSAILDRYESLKFVTGLRSLAQYLEEYCFDLQARRAFHGAGLGKEAEEQYFSKKPDDFWKKKQEDFSYSMRVNALLEQK